MEYQHRRNMIIAMARHGAFYEDTHAVRNRNRVLFHSTWFLLRSNTIQQIVSGNINQNDSSIINSVTLSNNIPRRSMEFVLNAPEQYQAPTTDYVANDEEEYYNQDDDVEEPVAAVANNTDDDDQDDQDDRNDYESDWDDYNYRTDF